MRYHPLLKNQVPSLPNNMFLLASMCIFLFAAGNYLDELGKLEPEIVSLCEKSLSGKRHDLDFIRVEGFVFAHVGDEGYQESCAPELIRRRWQLKTEHVKIFADIKKKHSAHAITGDITLVETAKAAEFFKADGVIITGLHTGDPPQPDDIKSVRSQVSCHVLVGSGVSAGNVHQYQPFCDAIIVGSSLKIDGKWQNPLDKERVRNFIQAAARCVPN